MHVAGGLCTRAVRGHLHTVDLDGNSYLLHKVAHKHDRSLKDTKENKSALVVLVISVDLGGDTGGYPVDLLLGNQDFCN